MWTQTTKKREEKRDRELGAAGSEWESSLGPPAPRCRSVCTYTPSLKIGYDLP